MFLLVSVALTAGVLLATQRYGVRAVLPLTGLLCLASVLLFNPTVGVAPLMGLIAGFQVERRCSYGQVVVAATAPGAMLNLWVLFTRESLAREELIQELETQLEAMGMVVVEGGYSLREMISAVLRVHPAVGFITVLFTVVLAYRMSIWGGRYLQISLPAAQPFRLWRPWDELIWVLIASLFMGLIGSGLLEDLALNLTVVMVVIYAVQGLALLRFFIWRLGISRLLEVLFYGLLFFTSGLALILLACVGLLETWFDWRHLRPAVPEEGEQ